MSWFGDDGIEIDERPRETVAEGVVLERRSLLRLSASAVAAGLLGAACASPSRKLGVTGLADPGPAPPGMLEIEELLAEMFPRAVDFVAAGGVQEEAYLMRVGELLSRLSTPEPARVKTAMNAVAQDRHPSREFIEMWVLHFDLQPGQGFSHHDHRDYNGVILGLGGELHARNYDILGDELVPPSGQSFRIRQTRDDLILPGRFSSLGSTRENVHEVVAGPQGAKLLDVFTYLAPGARSYFMDVDPEPVDAERQIFEAAWA